MTILIFDINGFYTKGGTWLSRVNLMKRIIFFLCILLLLLPNHTLANEPSPISLDAESAYLINPDTGDVLFAKNENKELPAASLTKIMNLTIASEELQSGSIKEEDLVITSNKAWAQNVGGSLMWIEVGYEYPVIELFKGIAIASGNDASIALAEHIEGSTDAFVQRMNNKALSLGMTNTRYQTVNGLPKNNLLDITTAKDQATLATYYIDHFPQRLDVHKEIKYISKTRTKDIPLYNQNPLLDSYSGITGLKTGYIKNHYNLIATAERDGIRLVAVTLKSSSSKAREHDAKTLLDYGFSQYKVVKKGNKGDIIDSLKVYFSKGINQSDLILNEDAHIVLHVKDIDNLTVEYDLPEYLEGGMKKGDIVGYKILKVGEQTHSYEIILNSDLPETWWLDYLFDYVAMAANWLFELIL